MAASSNELHWLQLKFPHYQIKNEADAEITQDRKVRDRSTKQLGVILEVKSISIHNHSAIAYAGYFSGAGVIFKFNLDMQENWGVVSVSGNSISDP